MKKEQLLQKIGKNGFLSDSKTLAAILVYISGVPSFDEHLDGKTLEEIDAVIHITQHPKGLALKIAKNFSSFYHPLAYVDIKNTNISEAGEESHLSFNTTEGKIIFSFNPSDSLEVKQFLSDCKLDANFNNKNIEAEPTKAVKTISEDKENAAAIYDSKNPVSLYIAVVSSLLLAIGCFLPWIQFGAIYQNTGIDNPDGAIVLVTAIVAGAFAIYNLSQKENKNTWVYVAVGVLGVVVFFSDMLEVDSRANKIIEEVDKLTKLYGAEGGASKSNFVGSGLYVVLLGAVGLILSGAGLFNQKESDTTENTVANKE